MVREGESYLEEMVYRVDGQQEGRLDIVHGLPELFDGRNGADLFLLFAPLIATIQTIAGERSAGDT